MIKVSKLGIIVALGSLATSVYQFVKGKKENSKKLKVLSAIGIAVCAVDLLLEVESNFRPIDESLDEDEYDESTFNANSIKE